MSFPCLAMSSHLTATAVWKSNAQAGESVKPFLFSLWGKQWVGWRQFIARQGVDVKTWMKLWCSRHLATTLDFSLQRQHPYGVIVQDHCFFCQLHLVHFLKKSADLGCPSPQKGTPSVEVISWRWRRKCGNAEIPVSSDVNFTSFSCFQNFTSSDVFGQQIDATLIEAQLRKKLEPRKIEPAFLNIWQERELDPEKNKRRVRVKKSKVVSIKYW